MDRVQLVNNLSKSPSDVYTIFTTFFKEVMGIHDIIGDTNYSIEFDRELLRFILEFEDETMAYNIFKISYVNRLYSRGSVYNCNMQHINKTIIIDLIEEV